MFGRDRGDRGALIALAIIVVGAVVVYWLSNPPNQIIERYSHTNNSINSDQYNQEGGETVYFGVLRMRDSLAQWIAAFAAIGSVGVSIWAVRLVRESLGETRKATKAAINSNRIAQQAAQQQLRAYINVVEAKVVFVEGNRPIFQVILKNGGATPAYECISRIQAFIRNIPLKTALEFTNEIQVKQTGVVGPSHPYHLRLTGDNSVGDDLIAAIKTQKKAIFVIGDIHYRDIFSEDRHTEFVVVLDDMTYADSNHQLSVWDKGNRAT